jgi:hypothetical protein
MTISANSRANDSDRLERTLELYRDLTVALRDRLTLLKAGAGDSGKDVGVSVKEHQRSLQTVLELEANLGKRRNAWEDGAALELDLAAARAEIAARLARWADG